MTTVELVHDAGPTAGLGHLRRMQALGAQLTQRGASVRFRSSGDRSSAGTADVVVVDSYEVRADDGSFCAPMVVAVDDLDRDLAVDVVVRPAPGGLGTVRERARTVLRGFDFALVDPPVGDLRSRSEAAPIRVLVCLGGADTEGLGATIASGLADLGGPIEVRHAPGPWSAMSEHAAVVTVRAPHGLGDELAGSHVAVTAGGVTMLESLSTGCATVVVPTADNQSSQVAAVSAAGAALITEPDADVTGIVALVGGLIDDPEVQQALAARGRALVDGRGAQRVCEVILAGR